MKANYIASSLVGLLALGTQNAMAACDYNVQPLCVNVIFETTTTWDGAPMEYVKTKDPQLSARTIELAPGAANAWHIHEAPGYIYVETGEFEVYLADGRSQKWVAGQVFNEVVYTAHYGRNPGSVPTRLVVMSPSKVGCPFMTPLSDGTVCAGDNDDDQ